MSTAQAVGDGIEGIFAPEQTQCCSGIFIPPGNPRPYHDDKKGGHGNLNMRQAIAESCDVYFFNLAERMGIERMSSFMTAFGYRGPRRRRVMSGGARTAWWVRCHRAVPRMRPAWMQSTSSPARRAPRKYSRSRKIKSTRRTKSRSDCATTPGVEPVKTMEALGRLVADIIPCFSGMIHELFTEM